MDYRKNKNTIKEFTDLLVWQEGHKLVLEVYRLTNRFPREERYSMVDQMRRAAVSVTSNIAEGFGRQTYKEKVQFYYLAKGSLVELRNQVLIAKDLKYFQNRQHELIIRHLDTVQKLLQGLIKSTKSLSQV
jgi:four helix bundle protein